MVCWGSGFLDLKEKRKNLDSSYSIVILSQSPLSLFLPLSMDNDVIFEFFAVLRARSILANGHLFPVKTGNATHLNSPAAKWQPIGNSLSAATHFHLRGISGVLETFLSFRLPRKSLL